MRKKRQKHIHQPSATTITSTKPQKAKRQFGSRPTSPYRKQLWFLFFFAIALYFNSLFFDYNLDDGLMITDNKFTMAGLDGIGDIMTNDQLVGVYGEHSNIYLGGRYRPLSQVCFAIEIAIFGKTPFWGHLINVLMYAFSCIFLFIILSKLFKTAENTHWYKSIPFIATALFIAHPLHTEIVANIKGRDELMTMLGVFAVLFFSIRYLDARRPIHLILSFIIFIAALLSKENAITFLAIIPLTLLVFRKVNIKDHIIIIAPLLAATIIYLIIRTAALGYLINTDVKLAEDLLTDPFLFATTSEKYATIMLTWGKYLQLMIFPHPLTHDYYPKQIPIVGWADFRAIIPLLIYLALMVYALIKVWKKEIIAYGILFFMITFSVTSNLVFNLGLFMNERFIFISLLGFTIIIAYLIAIKLKNQISDTIKYKQIASSILIIILSLYSVKTVSRNFDWKDKFTLFTTDVLTSSNSSRANVVAGEMLYRKAKQEANPAKQNKLYQRALNHLSKAITIDPKNYGGLTYYGSTLVELKEYDQARKCFKNLLGMKPDHSDATTYMNHLSQLYVSQNEFNKAIQACKILIKYQPGKKDHLISLANIYLEMRRVDTAEIILQNIILKDPSYSKSYSSLAEIYGRIKGNNKKAIEYLLKAYQLDPKNVPVLENLGIVNAMMGNFNKSIKYLNEAIQIAPNYAQLYLNMVNIYRDMGDDSKSAEKIGLYQKYSQ